MAAFLAAAIPAAISLASSIFGGAKASKAMRQRQRAIEQQKDENEDWYNRRYNEDATQRADAVRAIEILEDNIRKRNKARQGTQAVMGGNAASVAAANEADSNATAQAMAQIAAAGDARKDRIESTYLTNRQNLQNQLNDIAANKAQNTAQAIQGVGSAAANIMSNLSSNSSKDIWSRGGEVRIPAGSRVGLSNIDAAKDTVSFGSYVDQLAKQNGWGQ